MKFVLQLVGFSVVLPATFSIVAWSLLRKLAPHFRSEYKLVLPALAAFLVAYFSLSWTPVVPESAWQWLPYLVLGAAAVGVSVANERLTSCERLPLLIFLAIVGAFLLTPNWEKLADQRELYRLAISTAMVALTWSVASLPARSMSFLQSALQVGYSGGAAGILAMSGNMKLAQLAFLLMSVQSCLLVSRSDSAAANRALAVTVTLPMMGLLYSGYLNSFSGIPSWSYLAYGLAFVPQSLLLAPGIREWSLTRYRVTQLVLFGIPAMLGLGAAIWNEIGGAE